MELSPSPHEVTSTDPMTSDPTSHEDKSDPSQPRDHDPDGRIGESSVLDMRGDLPEVRQDGEVRMRDDLPEPGQDGEVRMRGNLLEARQDGEVRMRDEPGERPIEVGVADDVINRNNAHQRTYKKEFENFNGIDDMINLCNIIDSTLTSISVSAIEFAIFRLNFHKINIDDFMTDFLNSAIFCNSLSSLQHLLQNYCAKNLKDYKVYKRLIKSCLLCIEYKKPECLRQLLLHGTVVDNRQVQVQFPACSTSPNSLIHQFVTHVSSHADIEDNIMEALYQFGVNLYEKNDSGQTALQVLQTTPQSAVLYNEALEENRQILSEKLEEMMSTPLSLLGLCRLSVLRSMGSNYISKLEELSPLPIPIIKYLRFEDLQIDNESGFDSESGFDDSNIEHEYIWGQVINSENETDSDDSNTDFNDSDDEIEEFINDEIIQELEFNLESNLNSFNSSINESSSSSENDYELTVSVKQESHISYQLSESSDEIDYEDESSSNENQVIVIEGGRTLIELNENEDPTTIYFHDEIVTDGRVTGRRTTSYPLAELMACVQTDEQEQDD